MGDMQKEPPWRDQSPQDFEEGHACTANAAAHDANPGDRIKRGDVTGGDCHERVEASVVENNDQCCMDDDNVSLGDESSCEEEESNYWLSEVEWHDGGCAVAVEIGWSEVYGDAVIRDTD